MTEGITESTYDFRYTENEKGITATRVFFYDPASSQDHDVILPKVGDNLVLPDSVNNLSGKNFYTAVNRKGIICRQRELSPLAGHPNKFTWTCSYTNDPVDIAIFTPLGNSVTPSPFSILPQNLEFSGEFQTVTPAQNSTDWVWKTDGKKVLQPIAFRVCTITMRCTKYVDSSSTGILAFNSNIRKMVGKVNSKDKPFGPDLGGGPGCWLFQGCSQEMIRNTYNAIWWKCELEFQLRDPDYEDNDGWNKILRNTNPCTWDIPTNTSFGTSNNELFDTADLSLLITGTS